MTRTLKKLQNVCKWSAKRGNNITINGNSITSGSYTPDVSFPHLSAACRGIDRHEYA